MLKLFVVVLGLMVCDVARRQTEDTVHFRQQASMLPDSTLINYEIGAFGIIQGGGVSRFLDMSTTKSDGSFLRTESFTVENSTDSIRFVRWITYSDPTTAYYDGDSGTTAFRDWLYSVVADTSKEYNPLTSSFATGSAILYILEVRSASNDAVLARIDTVKAYRKTGGDMVWRHYRANNGSTSYWPLSNFSNQSIYFNVSREEDLPSGVSLVHAYNIMNSQDPMMGWDAPPMVFSMGPHEIFGGGVSAPSAQVITGGPSGKMSAYPNPTRDEVTIHLQGQQTADAVVYVQNVLGQVEQVTPAILTPGVSKIELNLGALSQGIYSISVYSKDLTSLLGSCQISIVR